jgi:hypothetical protein
MHTRQEARAMSWLLRNRRTPVIVEEPVIVTPDELPLTNPVVALLCIAAGWGAAMLALPAEIESRGALISSGLVFALCLCAVPMVSAIHAPKSIFRAEHVLTVAPVFWLLLDVIQGRYDLPGLQPDDAISAFTAIAAFVAAAWIGAFQRGWRSPSFLRFAAKAEISADTFFGVGLLAFLLAFLRFAIPSHFDVGAMIASLGQGRWEAPWSRGDLGGMDAFLDHMSYFGYILPALTVVLARRVGWFNLRTLIIGGGAIIIALFLAQSGGRRIIGVLFGSAAVLWFLGQAKVRWQSVVALAVAIILLLSVLELMLEYRNVGFAALFDPQAKADVVRPDDDVLLRVDDNFLRLTQLTVIFPEMHPYTTWKYALWVAVRPVPRVLWPGKPLDPGFSLPEFLGVEGVSYSSSVIGELFMAGGMIGVAVGGWFYGRVAGLLSRLLTETGTASSLLMYSLGLLALFAGMRSMIELVLMSYGILAWAGLIWLVRAPARQ